MTFVEHLEEFRWRLLKSLAAVGAAFVLTYFFSEQIFAFMVAPLQRLLEPGKALIGTGGTEAFFTDLRFPFVAGLFLAGLFFFSQIWPFSAPGLQERERRL